MIYFIGCVSKKGFIKIGYTNNTKRRLKQIQAASKDKLEIISVIEGDLALEQKIHSYFEYCRAHNEWFNRHPKLIKFINNPRSVLNLLQNKKLRSKKALAKHHLKNKKAYKNSVVYPSLTNDSLLKLYRETKTNIIRYVNAYNSIYREYQNSSVFTYYNLKKIDKAKQLITASKQKLEKIISELKVRKFIFGANNELVSEGH